MINLYDWWYDGVTLWGICQGHNRLSDGTYIHTSTVEKFELCEDGLVAYTYSGNCYHCKTEDIRLDILGNIKVCLEVMNIDVSFLDDAEKLVEESKSKKIVEVEKLLEENDMYIEFLGINVKYAYFKKDGVLIPLKCDCHVGTFQDSYLIREPGVVDVRYFDRMFGVDFYHVSDGINNIHFKYVGDLPLSITGIGDGLKFEKDDTEVKTIKPEDCKEGLISPDCVNGKSMINPLDLNIEESEVTKYCWSILSEKTMDEFKTRLENGEKLKVIIKHGNLGCSDVQGAYDLYGYLDLYKIGDNYLIDTPSDESENLLCVDDFEYIHMIVFSFAKDLELLV